tara:strand:- start:1348 stop:1521 length:174 start_codon:yes stop_codon:yes gene_type:complete
MMEDIYNRFFCFTGGNLLTISFISTETILETAVIGLIGGFVGMLAKDIYLGIKKLFK